MTVHDLFFLDHPDAAAAEIRRDYAALAANHARRAAGVITNSHYTAEQVHARFGVPAERITVCRPGAPRWRPRNTRGAGSILFIGTLEPRKNVPGLLRAYKHLIGAIAAPPPLVIAGHAPPGSEQLITELRKIPGACHLGYVSSEERQRLFEEAAMLVIPSLDEGFGMPALEAMAMGVPVIASDRGALPEVTGSAALFVDPADDQALAAAMARVLSDSDLAEHMSKRGIKQATLFSWAESADRLLQAYRAVMPRRH